jgi:hypothetical protein
LPQWSPGAMATGAARGRAWRAEPEERDWCGRRGRILSGRRRRRWGGEWWWWLERRSRAAAMRPSNPSQIRSCPCVWISARQQYTPAGTGLPYQQTARSLQHSVDAINTSQENKHGAAAQLVQYLLHSTSGSTVRSISSTEMAEQAPKFAGSAHCGALHRFGTSQGSFQSLIRNESVKLHCTHASSKKGLFADVPVSSKLDDVPVRNVEAALHAVAISLFACFS